MQPSPWRPRRVLGILTLLMLMLPQESLGSCPFPPVLDNSEIKDEFKRLRDFPVGKVIEYVCKEESDEIPTITITCGKNFKWSEPKVFCKEKTCDDPGFLINGLIQALQETFPIGSRVAYSCSPGFRLIGHNASECVLNGTDAIWSNSLPSCQPLLCAAPPSIPDGSHNGTGSRYPYGIVITYNCSETSSLIGTHSISCDVDMHNKALWKGKPPECKVVKCDDPVVEHGIKLSGFGYSHIYGNNITFECKIGYFMIGSYFIRCQENSTWYPEVPSCKKIDPGFCGAPLIPSGTVHPLQPQYKIGIIVAVTCNLHYSFPDETIEMSTVCQGYNVWEPPVQPCFFRTSQDVFQLSVRNGKIIQGKKTNYKPGDTVTIKCYAGYTLVGSSEIRYIGGKQWSPKIPSCSLSFLFVLLIAVKKYMQSNINHMIIYGVLQTYILPSPRIMGLHLHCNSLLLF